MKNSIITLFLIISCSKPVAINEKAICSKKDKTIDSLKSELLDCQAQAKIMADILDQERIKLQNTRK